MTLIPALARVPDTRLEVVGYTTNGQESYARAFQMETLRCGLSHRVRFTPAMSRVDLLELDHERRRRRPICKSDRRRSRPKRQYRRQRSRQIGCRHLWRGLNRSVCEDKRSQNGRTTWGHAGRSGHASRRRSDDVLLRIRRRDRGRLLAPDHTRRSRNRRNQTQRDR